MTLVELSITILLLGAISAFVGTAVVGTHQMFRIGDDQTRGLEQVKTANERLARDIRDARAVLCNPAGTPSALATADPTCKYHLQVWIDYNSDYAQESNEIVGWQLVPSAKGGHYNLVRTLGGTSQIEASAIVQQVAFTYDVQPGSTIPAPGATTTNLVNVNMTYDALYTSGKTSNRTVSFSARLRNVS
jgi:hypothetical protein